MQAEGEASKERFRSKRTCEAESMRFCLEKAELEPPPMVQEQPKPGLVRLAITPEDYSAKPREGKGWVDSVMSVGRGRKSTTTPPPGPAEGTPEVGVKPIVHRGDNHHPPDIPGIERAQTLPTPIASQGPPLRLATSNSQEWPRRGSRSTNASSTSGRLRQWQEPEPRVRIVQVIPDMKPREFSFRSAARSVVLSPDKLFAVFAFEKKIRVGKLVGFPAGSTKVDAPIVQILSNDQTIKAVAVSSEVLVVASENEVKVCRVYTSSNLFVDAGSAMALPEVHRGTHITSIAISRDSSLLAIGQRIDVRRRNGIICEGVVQLYSRKRSSDGLYYTALPSGRLSLGEGAEPAHVTISPDATIVLCAYAASLYTWRRDPTWRQIQIRSLELELRNRNNQGCRGITSITVFSAPASPDRAYCILTAILSAISGENTKATILAPLDDTAPCSLRCPYPEPDTLTRAAVSDASDIAVFLSDASQLRICRLVPRDSGGGGLLIRHHEHKTGRMGPRHRLEPRLCARLGVRTDGQDYVVVGVDREGKVWETRIVVSRFQPECEPAELMASSPVPSEY